MSKKVFFVYTIENINWTILLLVIRNITITVIRKSHDKTGTVPEKGFENE